MVPEFNIVLRKYKPVTPGLRHKIWPQSPDFFNNGRVKKLSEICVNRGGRNNQGKQTVVGRSSFNRKYKSFFLTPISTSYFRNVIFTFVSKGVDIKTRKPYSLWKSQTGFFFKANFKMQEQIAKFPFFDKYKMDHKLLFKKAAKFLLGEKASGPIVTNYQGVKKYVTASGTRFTVLSKSEKEVTLKLPSGSFKKFPIDSIMKVGYNPFREKKQIVFGSAGLKFKTLSKKSKVRGVAKNPVDHPHGGGEGRKSGIKKSPQGWYNSLKKFKKKWPIK